MSWNIKIIKLVEPKGSILREQIIVPFNPQSGWTFPPNVNPVGIQRINNYSIHNYLINASWNYKEYQFIRKILPSCSILECPFSLWRRWTCAASLLSIDPLLSCIGYGTHRLWNDRASQPEVRSVPLALLQHPKGKIIYTNERKWIISKY